MFKRLAALILCLTFLATTSFVFAEDVYVTKQGKKYHKSDCRFIKNRDSQKIDIEDAKAKGLEPCGRCFGKNDQTAKSKIKVNDENEDLVYVTGSGKKYHKSDCRLIKNKNATGISLADAQAKGLTPCGRCFSEQQAKAE